MVKKLPRSLMNKYEKLQSAMRNKGKLLIAFSGGVDSALLAKAAYDVLGANAWAVLIDSETVPEFELSSAAKLAAELGINFDVIRINQLLDDNFTRNDYNRCYFCRRAMAKHLITFANKKGITAIAAGAQETDLHDFRPGIRAFHEKKIWHPFIELGITKDEIRRLAKYLELPVAEKPSMACLSSRVPYDQKITVEVLKMVAGAEEYLRKLGFTQYRARTHGKMLRIEINENEFDKLMANRKQIIKKMNELGYQYITLDLEGFRSGSMNEVLTHKK